VSAFYSQLLGKRDRSAFSCGNDRIDFYFRQTVSQDVRRGYARCYLIVESDSETVAGFYTLSSTSVPLTALPPQTVKKLPRYPTVPAMLIGWLGRDARFRGLRIGERLLGDAVKRAVYSPAGAFALVADAIDETAAAFYRDNHFTPLLNSPNRLYLPLSNLPVTPPLTPPPA
jgi:ribosomal protein S18 acetylase RimI-like enzyme